MRDIAVRRRDTGDMRAVVAVAVALGIVGDIQTVVHIVIGKGDLGIAVQVVRLGRVLVRGNAQVGQRLFDLFLRQKVVIGDLLAEARRADAQAVVIAALRERGMRQIKARVDDGNAAACAGVAVGPGVIGANHRARSGRVGLVDIRLVLIFHIDALNAVHGADRLHLAVGHTRGNAVHADGELVAHGKRHAELRRNGLDLRALLLLQAVTVGQCRSVAAEAAGRIAVPGQGIAAEADDHTHRFLRRGLVRCVRFHILIFRRDGNRRLLQLQLLRLVCCKHCGNAAEQQAERQEDSQ